MFKTAHALIIPKTLFNVRLLHHIRTRFKFFWCIIYCLKFLDPPPKECQEIEINFLIFDSLCTFDGGEQRKVGSQASTYAACCRLLPPAAGGGSACCRLLNFGGTICYDDMRYAAGCL